MHTRFSGNALAETEPLAVNNSPVADVVFDEKRSLSVGTVEMRTRIILTNLTASPQITINQYQRQTVL